MTRPQPEPPLLALLGTLTSIWAAGIIGGGFSFFAGFYGPIWLIPSSNIAPVIGIFITGPLGLVIGGLLGIGVAILRPSPARASAAGAATGFVLGTALLLSFEGAFAGLLWVSSIATFALAAYVAALLRGARRVGLLGGLLAAFGLLAGLVGVWCLHCMRNL